jgi:hypothetical protein
MAVAAMSKDRGVTAAKVSDVFGRRICAMDDSRLTSARWEIITPLGLPVEPDVKIT